MSYPRPEFSRSVKHSGSSAILGAIAEFERARIAERVRAGLQRAKAQGKRLGRPRNARATIAIPGGSVRDAAKAWGRVEEVPRARWIVAGTLGITR
jgi:DNA invertase Pin-like site-specific DNA recombinase